MKISSIGQYNNIYAQQSIAMKARKSKTKTIQDFKEFLANNHLTLNAEITPTRTGKFLTELELTKKQGLTTVHLTDSDGYIISSSGDSLNSAIMDMAEKYGRQKVYLDGNYSQTYKCP